VRYGIVEGEPGIFPWPMGWFGRLIRRRHRPPPDADQADRSEGPADPGPPSVQPGQPDQPPPPGQLPGGAEPGSTEGRGGGDRPDR
jgi:hypothetical protein